MQKGRWQHRPLRFEITAMRAPVLAGRGLLHALLAEASAGCSPLTGLELGVALADDVERTLALHDLAICVTALHGSE